MLLTRLRRPIAVPGVAGQGPRGGADADLHPVVEPHRSLAGGAGLATTLPSAGGAQGGGG